MNTDYLFTHRMPPAKGKCLFCKAEIPKIAVIRMFDRETNSPVVIRMPESLWAAIRHQQEGLTP